MSPRWAAALGLALLAGCGPSAVSTPSPTAAPTPSPAPTLSPLVISPLVAPNLPLRRGIQVPGGFSAYLYARGLASPTAMAFGPDGRLYVTEANGSLAVVPTPGAAPLTLLSGLPTPLGLAFRREQLFVSIPGGVAGYRLQSGQLTGGSLVVQGLPTGRHQNDNLLILPDGDILLGLGSTCDVCSEPDPRSAAVLRFRPDWSYAGVVVRGTRNPYGLALRPSTGEAYVTVNGQDNLGPNQPADHLLPVVDGTDGGWPRCWPSFPDGARHGSCTGVAPPAAVFAPHSSADGIVFYAGSRFPAAYQDTAFVAEWGANAGGSVGRRIVSVGLGSSPGSTADFATGFVHPLGLTLAPDGGLLVADYGTGEVIEIANT